MNALDEIKNGIKDHEKIKNINHELVEVQKDEKAFEGEQKIILGAETEISGIEAEIRRYLKQTDKLYPQPKKNSDL